MGKFTKMALVLLYLLQLVVVFREQLTHLYKTAVGSVHHQTDRAVNPHAGLRAMLERVVKITRPAMPEAIAAASPSAVLHAGDDDGDEQHAHNEDDKKDRAKRHRHKGAREYLIANLWPRLRRSIASPSATGVNAAIVFNTIVSATIPAPSAKA